ncbi:MAG: polysaccharide biosynthesis tyrosine autokinase, partial [Erysipelotrichaceae bacterium]|nr:polysaccharide biosynthesis tyrosine autokinase [Erysipelotrichaceae bacterium]
KAEATVAVYSSDDSTSIDSRSAQQLGTVFPYILTSGILKDVIMEDMGVSSLPGSIKVTNVEGTNLLTISVSSGNPELSYSTLLSLIKNYPKVAEYVVGYTVMEIVDDSGIPTDSGKTIAVQGNAVKGAMYGLALGLGLVILHMMTYKTVRTVKDVRAFSTVDHLGSLPVYKKKKRKDTSSNINILEHNVQQDYLEAIRLIRTRVTRKLEKSGHKVVMVTSSVPGEGKSTIAANLAISLAGKSESVLLIDCDLRNPSLQEIFQVSENQPGLMEVLDGRISVNDAIVSYERQGIHLKVLFGSPNNPTSHAELLGSDKMTQIMEYLKKTADIIILDTPPSAMLVDAMLVAKYVDEAIYVIMSDYARASVVAEGMRELKNTGIEIGGYVLNGCKEALGGYGYHYYGYGSHYYGYQDNDEEEEEEEVSTTQNIPVRKETPQPVKQETPQPVKQETPTRRHKHAAAQEPAQQQTTHRHARQKTTEEIKPAYVGRHGKVNNDKK